MLLVTQLGQALCSLALVGLALMAGPSLAAIFVLALGLAFLPLVVAAVSILTSFLLLLPITYIMDVSFIVQFLIALIGLGVAIDYSLLFVNRWREERDHGRENHDAVVVAMQTAGHAIALRETPDPVAAVMSASGKSLSAAKLRNMPVDPTALGTSGHHQLVSPEGWRGLRQRD